MVSEVPMKLITGPALSSGTLTARAGPRAGSGRSSACCTTLLNRLSSNGLTMNSCAPARIASTALATEPLAVITTTLVSGRSASMSRITSSPSRSGRPRSNSTTDAPPLRKAASPSAAVPEVCTAKPAAVRMVR